MSQRRRYTATDVNALIKPLELERDNLRIEVASLKAKVAGLLGQLADADDALLAIDADTQRLGRAVREFTAGSAHPSYGRKPEPNTPVDGAPSGAFLSPTGGTSGSHIRPRLSLVSTTEPEGET